MNLPSGQRIVRLGCEAMATRFEVALADGDPVRLRAAGEEALAEVERLDARLSRFRFDSDISRINRDAARAPVKVEPWLFDLLSTAADVNRRTDGAFDITVAPLMRAWGFWGGPGRVPPLEAIEEALALTGMRHVVLRPDDFTVKFLREGVEIDLGGIAKGYAIDRVLEILSDSGVTSALAHGGTSAIRAIGRPPDAPAWRVAARGAAAGGHAGVFDLADSSLAVSAIYGRSFAAGGVEYGHVIDPRTGRPIDHTLVSVVTGPSAMVCDALSTALLSLGECWLDRISERFTGYAGRTVARPPQAEPGQRKNA